MSDSTGRVGDATFRQRFLDLACGFQPQLFYLFVIECVLLVLSLFSLLFVRSDSSYVILVVDLAFIAATIVPVGLIIYTCDRRYQ